MKMISLSKRGLRFRDPALCALCPGPEAETQTGQVNENDHLINLIKTEMQIRSMNQKIDLLLEEQIKTLFDIRETILIAQRFEC
jgi:hypothetical protein